MESGRDGSGRRCGDRGPSVTRAYYNEIDPHAAQWLRNLSDAGLIAFGDVDERDIRDIAPNDLRGYTQCHFFAGIGVWSYALRLAGWPDDRPVWTGSPPCQPFSAAGRGAGVADERHLWPHFHHLIGECRPEQLFGEQVASKDGLGWLDLVQSDMEGTGYAGGAVDLCAAGVGAPHIRQRQFFFFREICRHCNNTGWFYAERELGPCFCRWGTQRVGDGSGTRLQGFERSGDVELQGRAPALRSVAEAGALGELADDEASGRQRGTGLCYSRSPEQRGAIASDGGAVGDQSERPCPTNGFWRDADWLFCRDEKWRPVEPGTFPLVDGTTFRLDSDSAFAGKSRAQLLKGAGNAIVSEAAASIIAAFLDAEADEIAALDARSSVYLIEDLL